MKISLSVALLLLAMMSDCYSQGRQFPRPGIEFNPPSYICYRTNSKIAADGKLNEQSWQTASWTNYFVDIEGGAKPLPRLKTRAKMLWDEKYLYIAAEMEEPDIWATLAQRDTIIFFDNDFEIFIDPDGDTHKYYELEINAKATAWDLLLIKPYRDARNEQAAINSWDIGGLIVGIDLDGTINNPGDRDRGWTCEIAIPWGALRESFSDQSTPEPGEQWRVNFSRVEWRTKAVNGKYEKEINPEKKKPYPEDNWVWAPTGLINIHYPEMWGYVQLSDKISGEGEDFFIAKNSENVKWALRKLYYEEKSYYINNQKYTDDLSKLGLTGEKTEGYLWPPKIEATADLFEARINSSDGKEIISILSDGRILIQK